MLVVHTLTLPTIGLSRMVRTAVIALAPALIGSSSAEGALAQESPRPVPRQLTEESGTVSEVLGLGASGEPFTVEDQAAEWRVRIQATAGLGVAVERVRFDPNGSTGWHRYAGLAITLVRAGALTFYESDDPTCAPHLRRAGQAFLHPGQNAEVARNESSTEISEALIIYFVPPSTVASGLRIEVPAPDNPNCPS